MKACCPSKKDYTTPTKWSMMQRSVMFQIGCAVLVAATFTIPIQAFVVPMKTATMIPSRQNQPSFSQLLMDPSNRNGLVDTPMAPQISETITTTPTTIQVCGSKDCTRRGGGARLLKQIREVCVKCCCPCVCVCVSHTCMYTILHSSSSFCINAISRLWNKIHYPPMSKSATV